MTALLFRQCGKTYAINCLKFKYQTIIHSINPNAFLRLYASPASQLQISQISSRTMLFKKTTGQQGPMKPVDETVTKSRE